LHQFDLVTVRIFYEGDDIFAMALSARRPRHFHAGGG
jgi:hypothetical protein